MAIDTSALASFIYFIVVKTVEFWGSQLSCEVVCRVDKQGLGCWCCHGSVHGLWGGGASVEAHWGRAANRWLRSTAALAENPEFRVTFFVLLPNTTLNQETV